MLYEGSELLGAMGLFELHCSQRWGPTDSLSDTVVASSGNRLRVQNPRTVWLIHSGREKARRRAGAVGLKAATLSHPFNISQNRKFFNATYFAKKTEIVSALLHAISSPLSPTARIKRNSTRRASSKFGFRPSVQCGPRSAQGPSKNDLRIVVRKKTKFAGPKAQRRVGSSSLCLILFSLFFFDNWVLA